jgi:hypothetical protein
MYHFRLTMRLESSLISTFCSSALKWWLVVYLDSEHFPATCCDIVAIGTIISY